MNMFKIVMLSLLLGMSLTFSGCQGNNSDGTSSSITPPSDNNDSNSTTPILPPSDVNATSDIASLALSITSDQERILDIATADQSVIVVDTTPVNITLTAFDSNGTSASNGTINVAYPNVLGSPVTYLGSVNPGSITLSESGALNFTYTPPTNIEYLKTLGRTDAEFTFYDTADTSHRVKFKVLFSNPKYNTASLKLYPEDNITVVAPLENKVIELYLEDNNTHAPMSNEKIILSSFDTVKYGNVNSFSGTTDSNGRVVFNYTSPEDITDLSNLSLTFTLENEKLKTITKNINFNVLTVAPKYKDYRLSIFPQNSVTLREAAQSTVIEVYLENKVTNLPVSGEDVLIDFFENSKGTMNEYQGTTDASGRVLFNYTAPESITGLADLNITAKLKGDVNNSTYTTIKYDNTGVPKDYNGYTLYVVPKNADVTLPNQEKIIDVYLKDPNSRPAISETVYIDFFSGEEGTMDKYQSDTDTNGHASFTYKSPETLKPDGQNYVITIKLNGTNVSDANVTLNVQRDTNGVLTQLILLPSTINILKSEESKNIKILTLDANNVGVSSEIVIEQPNTDGTDYGSFNELKITTDNNGIADVNFTAPTNIDALADTNKTITVRDLTTLKETNLTIFYEKNLNINRDIYQIGLTQSSDIAVDSSGELYVSIFKSNLPTELIDSSKVLDVNVTSVSYNNMVYFDENNLTSNGLMYSSKSEQAFSIFTKQTSGVVVVNVSAKVNDGVSETVITGSFPVVINSDEMSSISMFLAKSVLNENLNIYNDYYTVHAVDKYGNAVKAGTVIHPSLVNGTKVESLDINGTGELKSGVNATFKDGSADFSDVNVSDRLIVLPSEYITDKSFFGNWDINEVNATSKELTLLDKIDKNSTAKLRYVIGNDTKVVTNNGSSSIALANIQAIDGKYETDSNGTLQFIVSYDPALKGEKVYLAANGQTTKGKVGVALEAILHHTGKRLVLDQKDFSINTSGESINIDTNLYDEGFNLITEFPNIKVLDFNNSWGTYNLNSLGDFIYTAPTNKTDFNNLRDSNVTMTFKLALEETDFVYETVTISFAEKAPYSQYSLKIIPDDFIVKEDGESKTFKVYVLDENNDTVIDERLIADFFDAKQGEMSNYSAISTSYFTNYASFTYIAPEDVASLSGTAFDFNISLENDDSVSSQVRVNYLTRVGDINYTDYNLTSFDKNITITSTNQSKVIELYLETNDNKPAANEVISLDFFNGQVGLVNSFSAITDSNGHVAFNYTAPSVFPDTNTSLVFHFVQENIDKNVTIPLYFDTATPVKDYTHYVLSVVPTDTNVSTPGESKVIDVYLENNSTNRPLANETILLDFFNGDKGTVNAFSATTDANGHAAFNYTAPDTLPADTANFALLTFSVDGNHTVDASQVTEANTTIGVNTTVDPKYNSYNITAVTASTNITAALQTKVIDLYVENDTHNPAGSEVVLATFFSGDKGTLDAFSKTTDANGHAAFVFTSPANVTIGDEYNLTFSLEKISSKDANLSLKVVTGNGSANYNDYNITIVDANRTLTTVNQQETFSIYVDANGTAIENEVVSLDFFNGSKGTVDSFSGTTDATGKVDFVYTAPNDLTDLNNTTLHFTLENNTSKEVNATIFVDSNAPVKDYSNYILSIVDANRTIITSSQQEIFNLYLENNNTNTPAVSDTIVVDFFDGTKGSMNSFSGITDANGKVVFTYTAPVSLTDLNDSNITFRIENTEKTVISNLRVSSATTALPKINMENKSITITQNSEAATVKVLAFYSNGQPYNSGSVIVRYPSEIVDGNVSGGSFTETEVAISNGSAIFNYVGPDTIEANNPLNFTFLYKEDNDANATLTVNYVPEIPTLTFDDDNITVTTNGETVTIGVNVFDSNRAPYSDGNIKIIYPSDILTGKDVGSFDASTVAVTNGKASFVYTAANPLNGNDTLEFIFYHDSQPILSEANLTVNIIPDVNQIVLTNYSLDSIYSTSMNLETSKQMTFYVQDDSNVTIDDTNLTSIKATILNPNLGTLEDTSGNSGVSLTVNSKNNVQMNLKSTTISGVIPVEVVAKFKDANNNDKNLTKVFNVVVLSGPPTAMSLSYASTDQNSSSAKFIENWVLTVTDKYNNLVDSNPAVSMGLITGYTQSSAATSNVANYLYFPTTSGGTLADKDPSSDTFTAGSGVFDNVDLVNDRLVLFGTGFHYDAFGKWDISTPASSTVLSLVDDFNGTDTSSLGFAVGHNFRNETCDGSSVVANVYAKDGDNILPSSGSMVIQVEYDYYLTGKSVMLWTNLVGSHNNNSVKIGTSKKVTLRGQGLTSESYSFAQGFSGVVRLNTTITNTVEFYKNANFEYAIEVTGDANWTESNNSMVGGITSCFHSGIGFVDINFTSPSAESGTVTLTNLVPSNEF